MTVGRTVRKLRKARGWSQEALSERAGVSVSTVTHIEAGKHDTRVSLLEAVAGALEISLPDLLGQAEREEGQ